MTIIIENTHKTETSHYATMTRGKMSAYIGVTKWGQWNVCVNNSSHKVWRGMGKMYASHEAALAAYKSDEMKAILNHAREVLVA